MNDLILSESGQHLTKRHEYTPHGSVTGESVLCVDRNGEGCALSCVQAPRLLTSIDADFTCKARHETVTISGDHIGNGLESRNLSLSEIREILFDESTEPELPDAIWRHIIALTRLDRDWELAAIWLLLPSLRRAARRIYARSFADRQEVESAMVFGVLTELRDLDDTATSIASRLRNAAYSHGYKIQKWIRKESPSAFIEYHSDRAQIRDDHGGHELAGPVLPTPGHSRVEGMRLGVIAQSLDLLRPRCSWPQPDDGSPGPRRTGDAA